MSHATTADSTPPLITTARHDTYSDANTVAVGIANPPRPTMMAITFIRRPRSSGKSSDESALDAVLMAADARPTVKSVAAATTPLRAIANSGRLAATSAEDRMSATR